MMHETQPNYYPSSYISPCFSKVNSFSYKDNSLSTSMCNNSTLKLICHGGLLTYMPSIFEVCEILDLSEDPKPPKINEKKL